MVDKKMIMSRAVLNGYTQRSLAEAVGINKNTLNRKLNGRADFTLIEVNSICKLLNIDDIGEKAKIFLR